MHCNCNYHVKQVRRKLAEAAAAQQREADEAVAREAKLKQVGKTVRSQVEDRAQRLREQEGRSSSDDTNLEDKIKQKQAEHQAEFKERLKVSV
jgi:hypothetical protein